MIEYRTLTRDELAAEARARFGDNPMKWAFRCPSCGDIATAGDFPEDMRNRIGQECVGRHRGALSGPSTADSGKSRVDRGCDWAAYGLLPGPWRVIFGEGDEAQSVYGFPLADPVDGGAS